MMNTQEQTLATERQNRTICKRCHLGKLVSHDSIRLAPVVLDTFLRKGHRHRRHGSLSKQLQHALRADQPPHRQNQMRRYDRDKEPSIQIKYRWVLSEQEAFSCFKNVL